MKMPGYTYSRSREGLTVITARYWTDDFDAIETIGAAELKGLPEVTRTASNIDDDTDEGGFAVFVTYEGKVNPEDGTDDNFELDLSFADEPIGRHPHIAKLMERYGGTVTPEGRVKFDPKLPKGNPAGGFGLGGGDKKGGQDNPLFMLTQFLVTRAIFRRLLVRDRLPSRLMDDIGTVFDKVPDQLIPTPRGRNWLKLNPKITKRGKSFELGDNYMLSAPGGWPKRVYLLIDTLSPE